MKIKTFFRSIWKVYPFAVLFGYGQFIWYARMMSYSPVLDEKLIGLAMSIIGIGLWFAWMDWDSRRGK